MIGGKKDLFKNSKDNIGSFLKSLDYWQTINLYTVLAQGQSHISYNDAKTRAILDYKDKDKLRYLLEAALNSPDPKI